MTSSILTDYVVAEIYSVSPAATVSKIPDNISFRQAASLPLGFDTACAGLFLKSHLALDYPKIGSANQANIRKVILVLGGASSVGGNAIQLASLAGYSVVATASTHNHEALRGLGAKAVVDYKSKSSTEDVVNAVKAFG